MVVLEPFVWIVSFVLKIWHLLLASVLRLSPPLSWTLSLLLLVCTVRSALAVLSSRQLISARKTANLRPRLLFVREYYRKHIDPEAPNYANFASKELREAQGLKTSALLIPIFVQLPVIMGLVRMVRQMVAASTGPGLPAARGVGFISRDEVTSFLGASFLGQPLSASMRMGQPQLALLGADPESLFRFCLISITAAALFTAFNLLVSWRRMRRTLDYSNKVSTFMSRFLLAMLVYAPLAIMFFGFFGPTPVALIVYWVTNNFWTLAQNIILTRFVERNYPLTADFHKLQEQQKKEFNAAKAEKKMLRKARRIARAKSAIQPWKAKQYHREYEDMEAETQARRQAKRDEERAQALEIAKVRYMVTQMRPGAQDNLPSLSKGTRISAGIVPPLPGVMKAREEKIRQAQKAQKAQSRPKAFLIAQFLFQQAGHGVKNKLKKATGRQESQWKRFRD